MKAWIGKQLLAILPWLLKRLLSWASDYVAEYLKKQERERRVKDLEEAKDEDDFDSATDRLP